MASVTFRSLFKSKSLCWKELSRCRWKTERAAQDHAKHIFFYWIMSTTCFIYPLRRWGIFESKAMTIFFCRSFKLQPHLAFEAKATVALLSLFLRAVHCPYPFFFFSPWKWINESRVFVCADQYLVMKAVLQFPTKASLTGWICFYSSLLSVCINFTQFFGVFLSLGTSWPR